MAELFGISLGTHLESIIEEFHHQKSICGYPEKKFYRAFPGFDFSVDFHDKKAATPLGPASGPHTQMVQNILLSFLGGGRIMELKTVQILDELEIPRPCIDARNICYNVEWSQELKLQASYREYVMAWVLLKIIEEMELLGVPKGDPFYNTIFDVSAGYDLKGISSEPVNQWLIKIRNSQEMIGELLNSLPPKFEKYKNLAVDPHIGTSLTLSTFHGCPRDEIESIVKHLISEHSFHVMVKMNPTLLGYDFVKKTLHDDLGYTHIELDPEAFEHDLQFDEGVAMLKRLEKFGKEHGKRVGAKFTNTLVVKNTGPVFKKDRVMYLSGEPLHVISMNTMNRVRSAMGDSFPVSFSAGITKQNFPDAVLCHMRPITTCTDLLRPGGYTRLAGYLENLKKAMEKEGCSKIEEYICKVAGEEDLGKAGAKNASTLVPALAKDKKYHFEKNKKEPRKLESRLELFDCITCDKCIPVCPNGANFSIALGKQKITTHHYRYEAGEFKALEAGEFVLEQDAQIANLADFCNECGNCDTFCPEHGGPYIEKPRFFQKKETYQQFTDHDGFYFSSSKGLTGRLKGVEYSLSLEADEKAYLWMSPQGEFKMDLENQLISAKGAENLTEGEEVHTGPYYAMRALLDGLLQNSSSYPVVILRSGKE